MSEELHDLLVKLHELYEAGTPGPWTVRAMPHDSFVEAPYPGRAYNEEILGDDYEKRAQDVELVAALHEAFPAMYAALDRQRRAELGL